MLNLPRKVTGISHPLIADMFLKKDYRNGRRAEDVLVIEAHKHRPSTEHDAFDTYLIDLLTELPDLKNEVERRVGKFDRIDIREHSYS